MWQLNIVKFNTDNHKPVLTYLNILTQVVVKLLYPVHVLTHKYFKQDYISVKKSHNTESVKWNKWGKVLCPSS